MFIHFVNDSQLYLKSYLFLFFLKMVYKLFNTHNIFILCDKWILTILSIFLFSLDNGKHDD